MNEDCSRWLLEVERMNKEQEFLQLPCAYKIGDELGFNWTWFLGEQKLLRICGCIDKTKVGNWRLTKDQIKTLIKFLEKGLEGERP